MSVKTYEIPYELIKEKKRIYNEDSKKLKAETDRVNGEQADLQTLQTASSDITTTVKNYQKAHHGFVSRWCALTEHLQVCQSRAKQQQHTHGHHHADYKAMVAAAFEAVGKKKKELKDDIGEAHPPSVNSTGLVKKVEDKKAVSDKADATLAKIQAHFAALKNTQTTLDAALKSLETIHTTIGTLFSQEPKDAAQLKTILFWVEEFDWQLKREKHKLLEPKELEKELHEVFAELDEEISKPREAKEAWQNESAYLDKEQSKLSDLENDADRQNYILQKLHALPHVTPPTS